MSADREITFTAQVDRVATAKSDGGGFKVTLSVSEDDTAAMVYLLADYVERVYRVRMAKTE